MQKRENVDTVRKRERESNTLKKVFAFILCAKNKKIGL